MIVLSFCLFLSKRLCEEGHSCTTKTRWVDHPSSRDSLFVKQPLQKHQTGINLQASIN